VWNADNAASKRDQLQAFFTQGRVRANAESELNSRIKTKNKGYWRYGDELESLRRSVERRYAVR
jgi:hypothetical protein